MSDLNDLYAAAGMEDVDVTSAPSSRTELTDGETYVVTPELVRNKGKNEKGTTEFGVMLRVLDGPDSVGKTYWENIYISGKTTAGAYNARNFHYLSVLGLPIEVLTASTDEKALTAAALGTKAHVIADSEPKDTGEGRWTRNHYEPLASATVTVADDEGGDDEVNFDY